jgi:Zn-dependent protease with chaperone function
MTVSSDNVTVAADRVARAGALLAALGVASSVFVVLRVFETWTVTPDAASHHISILGQRLSYPTANFAAVIVLALAVIGVLATAMIVCGAAREAIRSCRLTRAMRAGGRRRLHGAFVVADERPRAFCAGLVRPRVYVSTGALAVLDDDALEAVLAHERHHANRRDPLRLAAGRVLARALFYVPGLPELLRHHQQLAELSADESALRAVAGGRPALARAMLGLGAAGTGGGEVGIDPARVDHLLGEPVRWRFPALRCAIGAAVVAVVVAVGVLAGHLASGSATLAPPFLSRQPCVTVLALIPALLSFAALSARRALRSRR